MLGLDTSSELMMSGSALAEQLAIVEELRRDIDHERVLKVSMLGGFAFEVLIDHGMDIGHAWFVGKPVAWSAPFPPAQRGSASRDDRWQARWSGGLVSTCGPDNIGAPRRGSGQNGTHHETSASGVRWSRQVIDGVLIVVIEGEIRHFELFGPRLTVHREIRATADSCRLEVRDRLVNDGLETTPFDYLYHVNIGAPAFQPGSTVISDCSSPRMVSGSPIDEVLARIAPDPTRWETSVVFDHGPFTGVMGMRTTEVSSRSLKTAVTWPAASMPYLYQWVWATRGGWALGIEPASSPLIGADEDRPSRVLRPREEREFSITVTCAQTAEQPTS